MAILAIETEQASPSSSYFLASIIWLFHKYFVKTQVVTCNYDSSENISPNCEICSGFLFLAFLAGLMVVA